MSGSLRTKCKESPLRLCQSYALVSTGQFLALFKTRKMHPDADHIRQSNTPSVLRQHMSDF